MYKRQTYAYGSAAAHVTVDPNTGNVELLDMLMVEDVGRIVNPLTLHGQAIGAMVQGLGGAFLEHMIRRSKGYDVVVPIHNGQEEPLCAIYRKTCLKTIYDQISSQKFKITEFYKNVRVLRLNPSDSGFSENDMFFNINYPTDIKEALKRLKNQRLSS